MIGFSLGRGVGLWAVAFETRGSPFYVGLRAASRFDKGVLAKMVAVIVLPACWSFLERPELAHFCSATLARASLVSQCRPLCVCLALDEPFFICGFRSLNLRLGKVPLGNGGLFVH